MAVENSPLNSRHMSDTKMVDLVDGFFLAFVRLLNLRLYVSLKTTIFKMLQLIKSQKNKVNITF